MMFDCTTSRPLFKKTTDELDRAVKVSELRPATRPSSTSVSSGQDCQSIAECWHVIFAPDETRFAWLRGTRKVVLVPWNRFKNCLLFLDNTDDEGNEIKGEVVTIDAGLPVNSAAFGCGTPENQLVDLPKKKYWTLFDSSQELIFATGHVNGRVRLWDVNTGRILLELLDHRGAVRDMAFAPDGSLRLATASLDNTLKVWDLRDDGNMFQTLKGHTREVFWCCWSPNGRLMASAGVGKTVIIWDMSKYQLARTLHGHQHNVGCCEFSPDGAVLATASWDTRVILWDPYTGDILKTLCHLYPLPRPIFASGANGSWVRGVAYAKHGRQVATIADDGFIRFWNLFEDDIDPVALASGEENMICCAFSPSGRVLAVGNEDSHVSFYAAPRAKLSLKHLSRMAIRRILTTPDINYLDLPSELKEYLKYNRWN